LKYEEMTFNYPTHSTSKCQSSFWVSVFNVWCTIQYSYCSSLQEEQMRWSHGSGKSR